MPALGDNKNTVKTADSTDLSSLLNVLEWIGDVAFGANRRVDLDLVKKLRSKVRNAWAHASNQEMTDDKLNDAFEIATKFVLDLDKVCSCQEIKTCSEEIRSLHANGLTNVVEAELKSLLLLRKELCGDVSQMKQEIKNLKQDQDSDREVVQENESKLKNLEHFTNQCCARMEDVSKEFQKWRENLDNLFCDFKQEMASFREEIKGDISEIRADIKKLKDAKEAEGIERSELKSCLPEKTQTFTGRDKEVKQIVSFLVAGHGVVSLVGGPGFGKSTIAVEVSHRLVEKHNIPVIFSYLSNASTVAEVILCLCHDVGVHPGDDPKSSLIFWLRNIEGKVVLVMDNIEQLLEGKTRSSFTNLVRLLRKNSGQQLQIITTSRTKFSITDLKTENIEVGEMDDDASLELLKKSCPSGKVEDDYLHKLANLCGHVPLALCIAASRIQDIDDPNELMEWFREKPMEVLQDPEPNLHVKKAIKMSFEMLKDEDLTKAFVRLSVFGGNFDRKAAQEVINKDGLKTHDFLKNLADHSLIQRRDERYSIHPLVRRFLTDHDQLQGERAKAQELMVGYFLQLCQSLTLKSYSKDGFKDAKEVVKTNAFNVEETLKVCQSQGTNFNPNVIEAVVVESNIYQSSARFFYNFVQSVLPSTVIRSVLESFADLAKRRKHVAIEINFQCLLADQEGHKSAWNKSEKYMERMEAVKKAFESNEEVLKEDSTLLSHFYYTYGRYLSNKDPTECCPDPLKEANDYLEKSLKLRENKVQNPLERADEAITLLQLGRISKRRGTKHHSDKELFERFMSCAKERCTRALTLAKEFLGDHELTAKCYKVLGDVLMSWRKHKEALTHYNSAMNMYKKLQFDASEDIVYLLKNYGLCFSYLHVGFDKAMEPLNKARDMDDKLTELPTEDVTGKPNEKYTPCKAEVYCALASVINFWKPGCQEAMEYAKVAIKMEKFLSKGKVLKMKALINKAKGTLVN